MTQVWSRLNSKSRRCMERRFRRRRRPGVREFYVYRPRGDLLRRLAIELGMTQSQVRREIRKERIQVLRSLGHVVGDGERV